MEFLIMGIFGILIGVSWIRSVKREKDIVIIRYYKGFTCLLAGIILIVIGIIKVFDL